MYLKLLGIPKQQAVRQDPEPGCFARTASALSTHIEGTLSSSSVTVNNQNFFLLPLVFGSEVSPNSAL